MQWFAGIRRTTSEVVRDSLVFGRTAIEAMDVRRLTFFKAIGIEEVFTAGEF